MKTFNAGDRVRLLSDQTIVGGMTFRRGHVFYVRAVVETSDGVRLNLIDDSGLGISHCRIDRVEKIPQINKP